MAFLVLKYQDDPRAPLFCFFVQRMLFAARAVFL